MCLLRVLSKSHLVLAASWVGSCYLFYKENGGSETLNKERAKEEAQPGGRFRCLCQGPDPLAASSRIYEERVQRQVLQNKGRERGLAAPAHRGRTSGDAPAKGIPFSASHL